jgi:signal transduction histidine kinase
MVAVPTRPARDGAPAARTSDTRLWWASAGFGLVMCLVYLLIPARHEIARNVVVYPLTEGAAIAAVLVGVLRYRPSAPVAWLLIAGGFAIYMVGDLIWAVYLLQERNPFPSPADFFYLAGYPVIAAGLVVAVRRRGAVLDGRAWLDAAMVAVIGGLLGWIFLALPTIDDPSLSPRETFVAVSYPVGDLALLVVAVRFLMGASWRIRTLELLVLGIAFTLAGDVLFQLSLTGPQNEPFTGDLLLLLGVVCVGLAGLHETMPALTEEIGDPPTEGSETVRILILVAACLSPLAILLVEMALGDSLHLPSIVAAMAAIAILSVARADVVARRALRTARRESILSGYANELLGSADEDEILAVAARTASRLIEDGEARVDTTPASGPGASAHGFTMQVAVRGERVADLVADASPLTIRRARNALATVATELSLALERERLLKAEREATEQLAEQNERLRELDKMKDQFVSTVTHELRTPLTSMIGYLEILAGSDVGELTTDERQHFLGIVDRNCRRLNRLVDDILTAARMDSGRFSLDRTSVDLALLASERVESIRATAEREHVELRLVIEDAPPPLYADQMRLGQLLDNLLSNAVKFTPAGGVVGVTLATRGDTVHIEVADTGVGIPEDEVDKLFNRFFRASTAVSVQGTGLGLSIAKTIAEAHGGTVSVASEVGVGTTFSVDLPAQVPHEAAPAPAAEAAG